MTDDEALYRAVGRKVREARERTGRKISQESLSKILGISRASVVNIEAGRQHAPLHLLWRISEALGTDLALLIPRRSELHSVDAPIQLDDKMIRQIERIANGNADAQKRVAGFVSKLKASALTKEAP